MSKIKIGLVEDKISRITWWAQIFKQFKGSFDFCLIAIPIGGDYRHIDEHLNGALSNDMLSVYCDILLVKALRSNPDQNIDQIVNHIMKYEFEYLLVDKEILSWGGETSPNNPHGIPYNGFDIMERLLNKGAEIVLKGLTATESVPSGPYPFLFKDMFLQMRNEEDEKSVSKYLESILRERASFLQPLSELFAPQLYEKDEHYGVYCLTHQSGFNPSPKADPWEFLIMNHGKHENFAIKALSDVGIALDRISFSSSSSKKRTIDRLSCFCEHFNLLIQKNENPWLSLPSWKTISNQKVSIRDMDTCFPLNYKMAFRIGVANWETPFSWLIEEAINTAIADRETTLKQNNFEFDSSELDNLSFYGDTRELFFSGGIHQSGLEFVLRSIGKRVDTNKKINISLDNQNQDLPILKIEYEGNFKSNESRNPFGGSGKGGKLIRAMDSFRHYCDWKIIAGFLDGNNEVEVFSGRRKKNPEVFKEGKVCYHFQFWVPTKLKKTKVLR